MDIGKNACCSLLYWFISDLFPKEHMTPQIHDHFNANFFIIGNPFWKMKILL